MHTLFFPIVQCRAIDKAIDPQYQKRWVFVNAEKQAIDGEHVKLKAMDIDIKFSYLVLKAPEMLRLDIPIDVLEDEESAFEPITIGDVQLRAISEGELAEQWLRVYFGEPVYLMKIHPEDHVQQQE